MYATIDTLDVYLTLEIVRNTNGTGLDLKGSIRSVIIHLQKIPVGSAGPTR